MRPRPIQLVCVAAALWLAAVGVVRSLAQVAAEGGSKKAPPAAAKDAEPTLGDLWNAAVKVMGGGPEDARLRAIRQQRALMEQRAAARKGIALKVEREERMKGAVPAAAANDAMVRQLEQQYAGPLKQLYLTELHFLRTVCEPTKEQYRKIATEGAKDLQATLRNLALLTREQQTTGRAAGQEVDDPRKALTAALARLVKANLSPEQAARYQKELDQREAAHRRVLIECLVAKLDRGLLLTADQRVRLTEILQKSWSARPSWSQYQMLYWPDQYLPQQLPEGQIAPLLDETQKAVWQGFQRITANYWFHLNVVQGLDLEDDWDEDPGAKKGQGPERKKMIEKKEFLKMELRK